MTMEQGVQESSSPIGVLEDYLKTTETYTSSSKETSSDPELERNQKLASRWQSFVDVLRWSSKRKKSTLPPFGVLKLSKWNSNSMREKGVVTLEGEGYANGGLFNTLSSPFRNFTLYELQFATKNFSQDNLIGKGGYAEVYKGRLQDGQLVAVKQLTRGTTEEKIADFLSELGIMAHVNHPNITKLIGYGVEGGMHLVLEYSHLGSLASSLHGSREKLNWSIRYKVALGTAEGLLYLHESCHRRIIHRDIKAANILLNKEYEPQICDFGLAKWLPEKWTHHIVSKFEGTFGCLAPEYLMHGIVDEKTDVFAFGVLLLELITGRRALDCLQQSLVIWAKPLLRRKNIRELIDPELGDNYNTRQLNLMLLAASLCVHRSSVQRPQMTEIVQLLKGNLTSMGSLKKQRRPSFWKPFCEEIDDDSRNLHPETC